MDRLHEEKKITSAFESSTFDASLSIHVQKDATDIGSATISPSGRDVAIASKTGLDIIDLDSPLNPPRHLRHATAWNVADVQWSPFASRDYWVGSTANHTALIWNLNMQEDSRSGAVEHTLSAHTRAITDINFSAHHQDILATCAVDGYVHAWDLRRSRRPVMTFVDWSAGATQVKWNRQDGHIIASSHDRYLHIWDDRHGAYPLKSIEAHASKIYGIDWNRTRAGGIVTCSLDKSIRFWDYTMHNDNDPPERVIETGFPVWRARHTPFGWGLLAMPQKSPGNLYLFDRRKDSAIPDHEVEPVAVFHHGEKRVKEFLWRSRGGIDDNGIDSRDFQLVSWGDDKELKLQRVAASLLENVGYVKGAQLRKKLNITRRGAVYKTFRNVERGEKDMKSATIRGPRNLSSSVEEKNSYNALSESMKQRSPSKRFQRRGNGHTMRGRAVEAERRSKINWMSGIKFNSGEAATSKFRARRLSVISPNFDIEGDWDTPESLHEEIIRVHHQYSKVTFEDINIDNRTITVSMNGPWGQGGSSVFIKASIQFPDLYPGTEVPTFRIGKTSLVSDTVHHKLTDEVGQIAASFVARRRGCLEAAICYLLGEVDLEESQVWLKGSSTDEIDNLDGLADESSSDSDSDDELKAENSALISASQELDPNSTEGILVGNRRHANVPIARECGAVFSPSGVLVTFFPRKEDKFKSLLGSINLGRDKALNEPSFNTFSRLAVEGLPRTKYASINEGGDEYEDDSDSDGSQSTSSSDSSSSQFQASVAFGFWRKIHSNYRKGISTNRSNKSSGVGTGTGTGTGGPGTTFSKSRPGLSKSKNTIALHDLSYLIPAKTELAHNYAVFGEGRDVCDHNAAVALRFGYQDLADVWTFAGMLLQHEVPLAVLNQTKQRDPILVVAKETVKEHKRLQLHCRGTSIAARVKWGYSPLARPLIASLLRHFSQIGDIQMLAMLSCVFSEPAVASPSIPNVDVKLTQPQTPLSMKTPAFSLDYFPSDMAAWSAYQNTIANSGNSDPATPQIQTPGTFYGSFGSSNGGKGGPTWGSDPVMSSYSADNTPPPQRPRGGSVERPSERERLHIPQSQSLSTSPEDSRTSFSSMTAFRQRNTGIAASIAAGLKNPFSGASTTSLPTPMSSSPPTTRDMAKKKPSPVESMVAAMTPNGMAVTWGNNTYLESVREKYPSTVSYPGSSFSEDETIVNGVKVYGAISRKVEGITVNVYSQGAFDDEGCMQTGLLDFDIDSGYGSHDDGSSTVVRFGGESGLDSNTFKSYRHAYAELLLAWQLPYTRLEILKFDSMPDLCKPTLTQQSSFTSDMALPTVIPKLPTKPQLLSRPSHTSTRSAPLSGTVSPMSSSPHPYAAHNHHKMKPKSQRDVSLPHPLPPAGQGPSRPESPVPEPQPPTESESGFGLSITGYCLKHESRLEPLTYPTGTRSEQRRGGAVGRCDRCDTVKAQLSCVVCTEPVAGGYVACLGCGCVSHRDCAEAYFSSDATYASTQPVPKLDGDKRGSLKQADTGLDCPGGCDCKCMNDAGKGVVESWEVMIGTLEMMRKQEREREAAAEARRLKKSSREASRAGSGASTPTMTRSKSKSRRLTEEWSEEEGMGRDWAASRNRDFDGAGSASGAELERMDTGSTIGASIKSRAESIREGSGYVSRRLGQVRAAEGWVRRKGSSLRNGES